MRDGEQTPGVSLTPEEKVWIARNLDSLGVDVIEAGSAITSQGERDGIKAVVKEGLRAEICSFARALKPDIDYAIECEVDSVHLVTPVSDLHINEKLRKDRESVKQMMAHCRAHLARGTPVLLFPEGTRALDGRLQRFKDGAFRLAFEAKVPVVPVAVTGTFAALPKHGLIMRQRMSARVEVLEPIDPRAFKSSDELREAARAAIAAALPEEHRPLAEPVQAPSAGAG